MMRCDILSVLLGDLSNYWPVSCHIAHLIPTPLSTFFQSVLDLSFLHSSIFMFVIVLLIDLLLGLEVWRTHGIAFRTPKVHLYCDFSTPVTYNSSSNAALARLYQHLVIDSLHKPLYAAVLVGYRASFDLTRSGFTI